MDLEGYVVIVQCGRGLMQSIELIFQGSVVAGLLNEIDPDGSINRQAYHVGRRQYLNPAQPTAGMLMVTIS